jgi:hypothetical protein
LCASGKTRSASSERSGECGKAKSQSSGATKTTAEVMGMPTRTLCRVICTEYNETAAKSADQMGFGEFHTKRIWKHTESASF